MVYLPMFVSFHGDGHARVCPSASRLCLKEKSARFRQE